MKIRPGIFLILILLLASAAQSQEVVATLELGKREAVPRFVTFSRKDRGIVTLGNMTQRSSRYIGLMKYDSDLNRQWTKQVLEQNGRKNLDFMTVLGNNILVFVTESFPRKNLIQTYYYKFDLNGNLLKEMESISELSNEKKYNAELKYVLSINQKTLLCYKNLNTENQNEKLVYNVFFNEGESMVSGEISVPYPDDKFEVIQMRVANDGTVYIMGKYFLENRIRTPQDYYYTIFRHEPGTDEVVEMPVGFSDKYITDLTFKVDPGENLYIAGFYSNRSTNEIIGTIYQKLNPSGDSEVSMMQEFDAAFLAEFLSDRQIDRGAELRYFYLDNIILRSDGGVLLIAEKYYTTYNSYLDIYGYWVDQKIHHYDEIIIHSVSNRGELEWSSVVPKRQSSENNATLSYQDIITAENIYLVYDYRPKRSPRTIYYNVVGMNGKVDPREPLMSDQLKNVNFFPRSSAQISNSEALLLFNKDKGRVTVIAKVRFD
ncbi:MAG: hypothetical protein H6581_06635 [Bacteroidia bacterium]|nr:hypothetical protein [Bacteroidia bacterium]